MKNIFVKCMKYVMKLKLTYLVLIRFTCFFIVSPIGLLMIIEDTFFFFVNQKTVKNIKFIKTDKKCIKTLHIFVIIFFVYHRSECVKLILYLKSINFVYK